MKTIESNKLIAEFIGCKIKGTMYYFDAPFRYTMAEEERLDFHDSWDWLMAVVDKIESTECNYKVLPAWGLKPYSVNIGSFGVRIIIDNDFDRHPFKHHVNGTKIEQTYQSVIEFIQWYNNKTNK